MRQTIADLTTDEVTAYLDLSEIDATGIVQLDVQIDTGGLMYLQTTVNRHRRAVRSAIKELPARLSRR